MEIDKNLIALKESFDTKEEAIKKVGELFIQNDYIEKDYIDGMLKREATVSTYMGNYLAIPHGVNESREYVNKTGISLIQVPDGVNFGENQEVKIIMGIASKNDEHLELLQKIAVFASDIKNMEKLIEAESKEEIIELLTSVD